MEAIQSLPLRGRWREAPEGENADLEFSPPVSLALDSPLSKGAKVVKSFGSKIVRLFASFICI